MSTPTAVRPRFLSGEKVFCLRCSQAYSVEQIKAADSPDDEGKPWIDVRGPAPSTPTRPRRGFLRAAKVTPADREAAQAARKRARERLVEGLRPYCPEKHLIVDIDLPKRIIGVFGFSGAGKSCYLAGAMTEMLDDGTLADFDCDVSAVVDMPLQAEMDKRIEAIYEKGTIPPPNDKATVFGPLVYRLTNTLTGEEELLLLFDLAGEDCTSVQRIATWAPFLADADGIVVMVNPEDLAAAEGGRRRRGANVRKVVDTLSELVRGLNDISVEPNEPMIVMTLGRGDTLNLGDGDNWPPKAFAGVGSDGDDVKRPSAELALSEASSAARKVWEQCGGSTLMRAAESKFRNNVRYAVVSALGTQPDEDNKKVVDATPLGCTVPFAHILHHVNVL